MKTYLIYLTTLIILVSLNCFKQTQIKSYQHLLFNTQEFDICKQGNKPKKLIWSEFKIAHWDGTNLRSQCKGSICDWLSRLPHNFLILDSCNNCMVLEGKSYLTFRVANIILIPVVIGKDTDWISDSNSLEVVNKNESKLSDGYLWQNGHNVVKIYGNTLAKVSGRIYTNSGSGRILYLDFKNAPIVEYTKILFDEDKPFQCQ